MPFIASFIYGYKLKKTGLRNLLIFVLLFIVVSFFIDLLVQSIFGGWCSVDGRSWCNPSASDALKYSVMTLLIGLPLYYTGYYIKKKKKA